MNIVNCGYNFVHPSDFKICRPSGSGDYILLVLRSPAYFVFDGITRLTDGNAVVLFKKDTPQIYGANGQKFINDWVHFEADGEDCEKLRELGLSFDNIIELSGVQPLSTIIQQMITEMYSENKNSNEISHTLFRLLILKLSDFCSDTRANGNGALFERLSKLRADIFTGPQNDWSIDKISKDMLISCSYLQHLYKTYFHKSIKKDITSARLEYAKYLLFSTDYTVAAVSRQCGYENDVHFMRTFKQNIGMTPSEYRSRQNCSKNKIDEAKSKNPYCLSPRGNK